MEPTDPYSLKWGPHESTGPHLSCSLMDLQHLAHEKCSVNICRIPLDVGSQRICAIGGRLATLVIQLMLPAGSCWTSCKLGILSFPRQSSLKFWTDFFFSITLSFQQHRPEQIVSGGWQKFNNHNLIQLLMCTEEQVIKRVGYCSNPFLPIAHITIMMP